MGYRCRFCGETIKLNEEGEWVHMDGKIFKKDSETDSHSVFPVRMMDIEQRGPGYRKRITTPRSIW